MSEYKDICIAAGPHEKRLEPPSRPSACRSSAPSGSSVARSAPPLSGAASASAALAAPHVAGPRFLFAGGPLSSDGDREEASPLPPASESESPPDADASSMPSSISSSPVPRRSCFSLRLSFWCRSWIRARLSAASDLSRDARSLATLRRKASRPPLAVAGSSSASCMSSTNAASSPEDFAFSPVKKVCFPWAPMACPSRRSFSFCLCTPVGAAISTSRSSSTSWSKSSSIATAFGVSDFCFSAAF
mmetsp:Transcript_155203/g.496202  ORF Transcript_155203/g.496202 Transcript_155203/m.496202 type:complete len:246 (+) Transcript_155203:132-869(+)